MRIVAIGRDSTGPEAELLHRYSARLKPPLELVALPDGRGSPAEIKRREAEAILKRVGPGDFAIALDQAGQAPDSAGLATLLARWRDTGKPLVFIIGGAEGLDGPVISRADAVLSLGRLTLPHLFARALLAEQLYRAQSILDGHPYHRAGRPAG
ncbi:MAG TPA: 23S rRNA (pseudouridine(1915)-N(3))-methyltransferase RlmH [Acidiphilium sp.]